MPITLDGTNGITTPTYNGADIAEYVVPVTAMKNRIINGAMQIDQRNSGTSVNGTSGVYTLDRWTVQNNSGASRFTIQQNAGSVTPPAGFRNYLGITSSSSYSIASSDVIGIQQFIEGFNIADLNWGTSAAQAVTLSFWVRSSLTGTFGGTLFEGNAATASYPFSYTISSANTWTQISVTAAGPTIGTWQSTNGRGIQVLLSMGTGATFSGTAGAWSASSFYSALGATSVVGTNGATFYLTGVQLEIGNNATSFDYRPYGTELDLCRRYYINTPTANHYGYANNFGGNDARFSFPTTMRANPSVTTSNSAGSLNSSSPVDFNWNRTTVITSYTADAEL